MQELFIRKEKSSNFGMNIHGMRTSCIFSEIHAENLVEDQPFLTIAEEFPSLPEDYFYSESPCFVKTGALDCR